MKLGVSPGAWAVLVVVALAGALPDPAAAGPSPACVTVGPGIPPAYVGIDALYCAQIVIDDVNFVVHCVEETTCIAFARGLTCDIVAIVSPTLPCPLVVVRSAAFGSPAAFAFHDCSQLQTYAAPAMSREPQACFDETYGTACRDTQALAAYSYCGPTNTATSLP